MGFKTLMDRIHGRPFVRPPFELATVLPPPHEAFRPLRVPAPQRERDRPAGGRPGGRKNASRRRASRPFASRPATSHKAPSNAGAKQEVGPKRVDRQQRKLRALTNEIERLTREKGSAPAGMLRARQRLEREIERDER